jgi:nucleoid-associated protein YgaU
MGLLDFFKKGDETPKSQPVKGTEKVTMAPGHPEQGFYSESDKQMITDAGPNNDVYTVASGDSLSKIAKKLYGDANAWHKIYDANKEKIGDNPDLIRPGQRFLIPR